MNATVDSNSGNEDAIGKPRAHGAGDRRQRMETSKAASDNANATVAAAALAHLAAAPS